MIRSEKLETLGEIARSLVGDDVLTERLGQALALLRVRFPYERARIVVLDDPAWSYVVPAHTPGSPGQPADPWPQAWTAEIIRAREARARRLPDEGHYLGWPIVWETHLYGAFELVMPSEAMVNDAVPLIEAMLPLFASALAGAGNVLTRTSDLHPGHAHEAELLETLRCQIEQPLLLQPLIRLILDWVLHNTPATQASLHLQRWDGDEEQILTFVLPEPEVEASIPGPRPGGEHGQVGSLQLARRALESMQPLWLRNGHGLELALPITDDDGGPLGALVVVGDNLEAAHLRLITHLMPIITPAVRRAEFYYHLVEARTHLQQVFDGLPTGLALLDSDGRLLRANPAWPRLWGLAPEAIQPQQVVPWDMFEPLLSRLPDPLAFDAFFRRWGTEARETTFVLQHPHQELHMLLIPVLDSLGLRPSYLLAVNDVTRERELDRMKSEFVSVVSHELRTPLTSILGYTELLQAREFPAHERRELIDTVWKQASHLSNLVEDLLNVSRLDAGRIALSRWALPLSQLVKELTAQLNKALDQSRHRLLFDVNEHLPPVYADRDRVRQILGNLLSNAIKYSPQGGEIVLRADILRTPPPSAPPLPSEPVMLITVSDPGIGIPAEELPRIFERFYRVDNSNTRKIGGTGLGLAITQALVELHGGRIWVESTPGEGSTFFFTLPLATDSLRLRG
jgi:signal transduction histidine kinase